MHTSCPTRRIRSAAAALARLESSAWRPGTFHVAQGPPRASSADAWLAYCAGAAWAEIAESGAARTLMALLHEVYGLGESGVYGLRSLERIGGLALAVQYLRDLEATIPHEYRLLPPRDRYRARQRVA